MTLSFQTQIDGKPNYFIDKIWNSFLEPRSLNPLVWEYYEKYTNAFFDKNLEHWGVSFEKKIHTIREDKKNLWKAGNDIHFVINNRTKKRFQFAPIVQVKSIQRITIDYSISENEFPHIGINRTIGDYKYLTPTNHFEYVTELQELAVNDGFDSWEDFLKYFNKNFKGKIIHWTDLRY